MLTETEKIELPKKIAELYDSGLTEEAIEQLKERWLVFSHLPERLRDIDAIALTAVGKNLQASCGLTERLKSSIDFFEKAFNIYHPLPPISLTTARDTIFMLAFSRYYGCYQHLVSLETIHAQFGSSSIDAEKAAADNLIRFVGDWRSWLSGNKEHCICHIEKACPGFSSFSYAYAYIWAFSHWSSDLRGQYI